MPALNQKMIARTLELLDVQPDDRVLDLFCGLGNFTLPLARVAREVVGVEGEAGLVARARENAARNGLANAQFHAADLAAGPSAARRGCAQGFDKLLLDPPRSGADEVLKQLPLKGLEAHRLCQLPSGLAGARCRVTWSTSAAASCARPG